MLRGLRESLRGGDKALVGNSAYRRYLKTPDDKHFEIDDRRVAEDARYDGLYVLRTNMRLDALAVMLRYRELLKVEDIFRTTKSILDTRPIYHQTDAAIRGHIGVSLRHLTLHFDGATHRVDDAGEFEEQAVAGSFNNSAVMFLDFGIGYLAPDRF